MKHTVYLEFSGTGDTNAKDILSNDHHKSNKTIKIKSEIKNWLRDNIQEDKYDVRYVVLPGHIMTDANAWYKFYVVARKFDDNWWAPAITFCDDDDFFLFRMTWL